MADGADSPLALNLDMVKALLDLQRAAGGRLKAKHVKRFAQALRMEEGVDRPPATSLRTTAADGLQAALEDAADHAEVLRKR